MKTVIGIAKEYEGLTEIAHKDALEWCKACLRRRIVEDSLENRVDWNDLDVKVERIDDFGLHRIECRLPLKK